MAVSEKSVLRVTDLLDWIADPKDVKWDRGILGVYEKGNAGTGAADDANSTGSSPDGSDDGAGDSAGPPKRLPLCDEGLNAKFSPGHSEFLADIRAEKKAISKEKEIRSFRTWLSWNKLQKYKL